MSGKLKREIRDYWQAARAVDDERIQENLRQETPYQTLKRLKRRAQIIGIEGGARVSIFALEDHKYMICGDSDGHNATLREVRAKIAEWKNEGI